MRKAKNEPKQDVFDVEALLIPENHIRTSMKTAEFDRYIKVLFKKRDIILIYRYRGIRYLFMNDDFVVEEIVR